MIDRAVQGHSRIATDLADVPLVTRVDPGQAQLVLLNLVVNANDAMPGGGTVTVRTRRTDDGGVELTVEDEGTGIPKEILGRIFEPFVTTKAPGEGTGLGLATCHGVVTRAGGSIRAENLPRRGAALRIALPAAEGELEPVARRDVRSTVGGTERVLVVEDNPSVRELTARLLHDLGYAVRVVPSAEAALDEPLDEVDVVVTDVGLPGMTGIELARALLARPSPPAVVLVSGQATAESAPDGLELLGKPFTIDTLAATLRRTLDARTRSGQA